MKTNFIYPVIIAVLVVLLFMKSCNKDKNIVQDCTTHSITIDSLKNIINTLAEGKSDTTIIDTFYTDRTVVITKTIPKIVEVPIYVDNTDDSVRVYTYASTKESVVATDTIEVKGEILKHKQTIHITEPCPILKETVMVPIVTTDTITKTVVKLIPHRFQLKAGLMVNINDPKNLKPTATLAFRKFDFLGNYSYLNKEWNVGIQFPILTIKGKR